MERFLPSLFEHAITLSSVSREIIILKEPYCHTYSVVLREMKSINRTFRLDEDLLRTVHEVARQKNVSLNEFVADALREAAADALMEGIEMEQVPSTFMLKLMELVPTERMAELAKWSTFNFSRRFVWQIFKELSSDTLIKGYEVLAKKYKNFFSFEHYMDGSDHVLRILHSRGQKWSVYYAESMRSAFKDLLGVEIEVKWGANEVVGRFAEHNTATAKGRQVPQIAE